MRELNLLIDHNIHGHRPSFKTHDIIVGNDVITLHARDILDCVKALYGDPEFAAFLKFKPERHYQVGAVMRTWVLSITKHLKKPRKCKGTPSVVRECSRDESRVL